MWQNLSKIIVSPGFWCIKVTLKQWFNWQNSKWMLSYINIYITLIELSICHFQVDNILRYPIMIHFSGVKWNFKVFANIFSNSSNK